MKGQVSRRGFCFGLGTATATVAAPAAIAVASNNSGGTGIVTSLYNPLEGKVEHLTPRDALNLAFRAHREGKLTADELAAGAQQLIQRTWPAAVKVPVQAKDAVVARADWPRVCMDRFVSARIIFDIDEPLRNVVDADVPDVMHVPHSALPTNFYVRAALSPDDRFGGYVTKLVAKLAAEVAAVPWEMRVVSPVELYFEHTAFHVEFFVYCLVARELSADRPRIVINQVASNATPVTYQVLSGGN